MALARAVRADPGDAPRDFCLWDYERPRPTAPDALKTEALLYASFAATSLPPKMQEIVTRIRENWGPFMTVWGMKWSTAGPSWELYFYDYAREGRRLGVSEFLDATHGLIACDLPSPDDVPYFMFSVELTEAHLNGAPLEQIDFYIGNPGSEVSSGICYGQTARGRELRNFYFFFDAARQKQAILDKLTESAFLDQSRLSIPQLLWPQMEGAEVIVVANKKDRDSLYFSRVGVDQLAHFMQRLDFPAPLRAFLDANRDALAHHLYDVGWDYEVAADGGIVPTKGSIYGIF